LLVDGVQQLDPPKKSLAEAWDLPVGQAQATGVPKIVGEVEI